MAIEDRKKRSCHDEATQMSDLTGRRVEPWEVAFFNGAAILHDVIPVQTRDHDSEQVAFRGGSFRAPTRRGHRQEAEEVSAKKGVRLYRIVARKPSVFFAQPKPCLPLWSNGTIQRFCYEFVLCLGMRNAMLYT